MTARLDVRIPGRAYPVLVGAGLLEHVANLVDVGAPEVIGVVSDAHVMAMHGDRVLRGLQGTGARVEAFTIEPGERSKSVAAAESLWRWLASIGAHRSDVLVALGGGVVGDLAGFVAATYHRGMPWVQAPTTLLGMVDAAIGGKTAVDIPEGKNLVGAFHQPLAVLSDTGVLQTLPDAQFATGMAEVVKHGLISTGGLHEWLGGARDAILARDEATLEQMVVDAARVKVDIVSEDETEHGARMFLNYGHTLGHALEAVAHYSGHTHGEAVAIGMMFAAHLARRLGARDLVAEHTAAIGAFGLPTGGAGFDFDSVATAWKADKKYEHGIRFVLLEGLGRPVIRSGIPDDALRAAYEAVR